MLKHRVSPHIVRVEGVPQAHDLCVPHAPLVPGPRSGCLAARPGFDLAGFLACAALLPAVGISGGLVTPPAVTVDVQLYSREMTRETVTGNDPGEAG